MIVLVQNIVIDHFSKKTGVIYLKLTFRVVKFNNVFTIYIDFTIYLYD